MIFLPSFNVKMMQNLRLAVFFSVVLSANCAQLRHNNAQSLGKYLLVSRTFSQIARTAISIVPRALKAWAPPAAAVVPYMVAVAFADQTCNCPANKSQIMPLMPFPSQWHDYLVDEAFDFSGNPPS